MIFPCSLNTKLMPPFHWLVPPFHWLVSRHRQTTQGARACTTL